MKKIKLYLAVFGVFCLAGQIYSQSTINDDQAHRRYWYYRTRFINDFVKMGTRQGECIVLAERNMAYSTLGLYDTTAAVGPDQIDLSNMYLATLALEYKLLTRNSQNTDETIKEMYQLLYTLNRLDLNAEEFYSKSISDSTDYELNQGGVANGYMMREDFPPNFIRQNLTHFNYSLLEAGYNGSNLSAVETRSFGGFTEAPHVNVLKATSGGPLFEGGRFPAYLNNPTIYPKSEVSLVHDKYYSMLAAFMFIAKYIPANTKYYENGVAQQFQDGGYGIKEQAIAIANRMMPYLQGNVFPVPNGSYNWILSQPDGSHIGLAAGASMVLYSFATTKAVCYLNNSYPWGWADPCPMDPNAALVGAPFYSVGGGVQTTMDNAVFMAWNHVISNFPIAVTPCWLGMTANTSYWDLQWAELAREVLFQSHPVQTGMGVIENPIADAPCNGPYNFSDNSVTLVPNVNWSSQDRTEHPRSMGSTNPFRGNYPGVDYMFLHNLFYEYLNQQNKPGKYDNAINLMDDEDDQTWPQWSNSAGGLIGTVSSPQNIHVFQNLSSRAQINNLTSSKVDYRAGKEIALLPEDGSTPGFSADDGTDFSAYIQRYLCNGTGDYGGGLRPAGNIVYDYEADEMNTTTPLHHVSYPPSASDLFPGPNTEPPVPSAKPNPHMEAAAQMEVLPNPNNGMFTIRKVKRSDTEKLHLRIMDMKGTLLLDESNYETHEIDMTNYAAGIYMVQLNSSLGYSESKKINITK